MIRQDLVKAISKDTGLTAAQSKAAMEAGIKAIKEAVVRGEKVELVDFGKFITVDYKARAGRDPRNGRAIQIPAKKVVRFVAGKHFANAVKNK